MVTIKQEIEAIQEHLWEYNNTDNFYLRYIVEGTVEAVDLCIYTNQMNITVQLWDSENDPREFWEEVNDYEPFYTFLQRKINECLTTFNDLKVITNKFLYDESRS